MKTRLRETIFALLLCCVCLPVRADLITIAISGQVTGVGDQYGHLENKIHINDTFTGTYTYHSTILDSDPAPDMGVYDDYASPAGITLTIGSFVFETDPHNIDLYIGVNNDAHLEDKLNIASNNNLPLSNGTQVQHIIWQLDDSTSTALSSDALPTTAPDLSRWSSNSLSITTDRDFGINATITSAVLIPEPTTLLLLVFGVAILKRR